MTREQRKQRKRAVRRDLILISAVILFFVGAGALANYIMPPVAL